MNAHTTAAVAEVDGFTIVGPDGTPTVETPAATADRMARLADELAALVNDVCAALALQGAALSEVAQVANPKDQDYLQLARTIARRSVRSLDLVMDSLGEVHVTCDQLARDLHTAGGDQR